MAMTFPKKVKLVEVSPRDGLQNETGIVNTQTKIEFINQLSNTGLSVIEVTSFVSPKWVPQLADNQEVFSGIEKKPGVHYPVLIPNRKGLEMALAAGVKEIAVFTTPSQLFSQKNTNCTVEESLNRIHEVIVLAKSEHIPVRGYLSCVLGCPYEGEVATEKVIELTARLIEMGCYEISLGDTIGVGTPLKTQQLLAQLKKQLPIEKMAVHFHDTYGQALANILMALSMGVTVIDSAVAGIGGCPYAKGATGNVATEDVLYMLNGMNIETGVNFDRLVAAGRYIAKAIGKKPASKANIAWDKQTL